MGSQVTDTPALTTNPKFIFFTDFDGTITLEDSNDFLTDNIGFGYERRRDGRKHFRDAFREMMDSVTLPFDKCIEYLKANVKLDPVFKEFYNNIPVVIISGGMRPIIRALLVQWLGEDEVDNHVQIVSNQVAPREGKSINDEGGWQIVYHDDSVHGHDKSIELRKYSSLPEQPVMFYAGDDLVSWCERENVSFVTFNDFSDIMETVKQIVDGKVSVKDAARGRIHH
ncbi:phosphoserine phosphatase [Colletotrichum sojae]|uniref:Phosphoserine phosphatase n=1 Tax=Colletotrichum sojae TaxID=2175907 RepID=A0A8H6INH4_9PEZI|nr:phosphoserine phosphatase [Colletotrichum sojae]